jgi:hypothetical protein
MPIELSLEELADLEYESEFGPEFSEIDAFGFDSRGFDKEGRDRFEQR